jgi:hypothetical protein
MLLLVESADDVIVFPFSQSAIGTNSLEEINRRKTKQNKTKNEIFHDSNTHGTFVRKF